MTALAQNRLIWKDFRELMPLFLAGCLAFVVTIAATCFSWSGTEEFRLLGPIAKLISPLNLFANICGLVLGVLLFAPEKENRTSQLLANMPVTPRSIAMTKLRFGILGLACFVTFCYLCVAAAGIIFGDTITGWPPTGEIIGNLFVPVVCFVWGVFWSLKLRSTLFAMLAAASSVLVVESLANIFLPELFGRPSSSSANSLITWLLRVPVLALVVMLVVQALPLWLRDEPVTFRMAWSQSRQVLHRISNHGAPRGVLSSLVWQSFRQSRVLLIVSIAVCGLVAIVVGMFSISPDVFSSLLTIAYAVSLFASSLAFAPDHQRHRYRFFQQHTEHGKQLWLARLLPSAGLVVLATLCVTSGFDAISVLNSSNYYSLVDSSGFFRREFDLPPVDGVLLHLTPMKVLVTLLTGMAIGQFFSMLVSSPIVSVVCAVLYGILGFAWAFLMMVCDASLVLFLLPIALILLFSTWVRAPRWLADRKSAFDRYQWLALLVAAFLVVGGFFVNRAVEVPKLSEVNGLINENYVAVYDAIAYDEPLPPHSISPELVETSRIFQNALVSFAKPGPPDDQLFDPGLYYSRYLSLRRVKELETNSLNQIVESNQKSLSLIHEAIEQNGRPLFSPESERERYAQIQTLQMLLVCEAEYWRRRNDQQKVLRSAFALFDLQQMTPANFLRSSTTFELFYQWSEMPGQSSQQIKKVISELDLRVKHMRECSNSSKIAFRHLDFRNQLEEAVTGFHQMSSRYVDPIIKRSLRWMPWEVERAKRVGEHLIEHTKQWDQIVDAILANPRRYYGASVYKDFRFEDSPYLQFARTSLVVPFYHIRPLYILRPQLNRVQLFRYTKIRMALSAWKLDHGDYPTTLEDLVPKYLEVLPCEVYVGGEFYYSATGLDHPVVWGTSDSQSVIGEYLRSYDASSLNKRLQFDQTTPEFEEDKVIPSRTPFLLPWSSAGGQITTKVVLTREEDEGPLIDNTKVECLDVSDPHGMADNEFFYLDFELPKIDKAP